MTNKISSKLLKQAEKLFMCFGTKSVSMDDIASGLGISKKTLYQNVCNKKALVKAVFRARMDQEKQMMTEIVTTSNDAVEEIVKMAQLIISELANVSASMLFDLEKYHKDLWIELEEYRKGTVYQMIYNNIERGKQEGLYREDVHSEITSRLYLGVQYALFDSSLFELDKYPLSDVFKAHVLHHVRGVATKDGLELLEQYLDNYNQLKYD